MNPFKDTTKALYYQYSAVDTGDYKCYESDGLVPCEEVVEVTAHCLVHPDYALAVVDIWVVDEESLTSDDKAHIPICCEPDPEDADKPTALYSFKVYCDSKCPDDGRRLRVEAVDKTRTASAFEVAAKQDGAVFEPSSKETSEHFCASEDYPCGDNDGLVHVCHYSAKDGYQTYCVPESDTDVVAYFPKDYCGPCIGGYGSSVYRN